MAAKKISVNPFGKNPSDKQGALRILDANINRAVEGVRVVEDAVRFIGGNEERFEALRDLRHKLRKGTRYLPGNFRALLEARGADRDVGAGAEPRKKTEARDLFLANMKRAQEAVRVIEEFSKPLSMRASRFYGALRFDLYKLEKSLYQAMLFEREKRFPLGSFLYAIGDVDAFSGGKSYRFLFDLLDGGADVVQLREKSLGDRKTLEAARRMKEIIEPSPALFVVNDRVDLALACGADGAHLGQDDLPLEDVRGLLPDNGVVGLSSHSYAQAMRAAELKPTYIAFGAVYPSLSKPDARVKGLATLKRIRAKTDLPLVAIGGMDEKNMGPVLASGVQGIAMISALTGRLDLKSYVRRTKARMEKEFVEFEGDGAEKP